ncbi:hypothetical protein ACJ72_00544 [Emergomyces africanus]|uniref:Plastocyanin-like domain-containing protein n=1 Tax=Emergomyces africanus TaxID=1955775 RepID=A0A1B7P7Q8_9EURO|nr:hypothetical protein ACJ72_00544 [Emergomyces africanus]
MAIAAAFGDIAARGSHHGKTHHIDVGTFGGEVKFVPNQIDAMVGDTVYFNFLAKSYSLTHSDFETPWHAPLKTHKRSLSGSTKARHSPIHLSTRHMRPKGSKIHLDFRATNHTLTEPSFDGPCIPLKKRHAIDTGVNHANPDDIPNLKSFHFTTHSHKPRYFYCRQGARTRKSHCADGLVFDISVSQEKFNKFRARAMATLPKIKSRGPTNVMGHERWHFPLSR